VNVLVDTSVWADFFNDHPSREARTLARFLEDEEEIVTCGVVLAEFFQGLRKPGSAESLEPYFREMRCLSPAEPDTYLAVASLHRGLRRRGVTVRSTIDCLIARLAQDNEVLVLSKDSDLRRILESDLCAADAAPLTAPEKAT